MKEVVLTNFATMFAGAFTPFASKDDEGKQEVYWKCDTCGERAIHGYQQGAILERTLKCSCRENFTYDVEMETDMAKEAIKLLA